MGFKDEITEDALVLILFKLFPIITSLRIKLLGQKYMKKISKIKDISLGENIIIINDGTKNIYLPIGFIEEVKIKVNRFGCVSGQKIRIKYEKKYLNLDLLPTLI